MGMVVPVMAVIVPIFFIDHIIHAAYRAYARFVTATSGAVHRANVRRGIFRAGFIRGIHRFFGLVAALGISMGM